MAHPRTAAFVLFVALTSACGSTVATTSRASLPGGTDALGNPVAAQPTTAPEGGAPRQPVSSGSDPAQVAPTPSAGGPSYRGVVSGLAAPVTTPLVLGVLDSGSANSAAAALGSDYSTSAAATDVTKAIVRWFNKHGGIAGRKIEMVEYTIQPTAPNYVVEVQAACASFTQDHHVAAVISVIANAYYSNYEECLSKAGVPDFIGPTGGADDHDLAQFPGMVSVTAPSINRRFSTMMSRFASTGFLTPKNKVGIVVEDCPYNTRVYDGTVAPLAKRLGLSMTRRDVSCVQGFQDAGAYVQGVGAAVLPFRSAGVDRLMFLSNFEGVGALSFENVASNQGYRPSYALTSTSGGAAMVGTFSAEQMSRMHGVGWTPVLDISKRVFASPTTKRCRSILASEGITPKSKADDLLDLVCDQFFALEAALLKARGASSRADLLRGLQLLGTSYVSPYTLGGATDYGTRRDGPRLFAEWGYRAACGCMDYVGKPAP